MRRCLRCDWRDRLRPQGRVKARSEHFDLVLDLGTEPYFRMHQPPQGYWRPGRDASAQADALAEIAAAVGDFEKPKYFNYKAAICAHSRSQQPGCNQCIDVCSTVAIKADGDHIRSNRICAWAAARARRCAPRAR